MKQTYFEKDGKTLIIDHDDGEWIYYRTWNNGRLLGLSRMPVNEFDRQIREWLAIGEVTE
jgi:hypothetical protein